VIKHIAEPDMHSMPHVAVHPSGKFFLGQSQDNQILVFSAEGKYKLKRDKRFLGHLTAGYACEIGFSPDGQYVISGDAQGRVVMWSVTESTRHRAARDEPNLQEADITSSCALLSHLQGLEDLKGVQEA
jgi:WD40 repeat protein